MTATTLTPENYYQDTEYMSKSRFSEYIKCEAKQLAVDNGLWEKEKTKAMLIGNYIHSYFESKEAHEAFLEEEGDKLFTKQGKLYKDFEIADKVIEQLDNDDYFLKNYHGGKDDKVIKEQIISGELGGMLFKGKVDTLNLSKGYFMDLKTMQSIHEEKYSPVLKQYVPQVVYNIFEYGYPMQMYIYKELLEQQFDSFFIPYIVAVSKQELADKQLIRIDNEILEVGRKDFEEHVKRVKQVVSGRVQPRSCGKCDYCRANSKLSKSVTVSDILNKAS